MIWLITVACIFFFHCKGCFGKRKSAFNRSQKQLISSNEVSIELERPTQLESESKSLFTSSNQKYFQSIRQINPTDKETTQKTQTTQTAPTQPTSKPVIIEMENTAQLPASKSAINTTQSESSSESSSSVCNTICDSPYCSLKRP